MTMKRTPSKQDADALLFCGILGHRFVTTIDDSKGARRSFSETNESPTLPELKRDGVADSHPRTFERANKRWRRVR